MGNEPPPGEPRGHRSIGRFWVLLLAGAGGFVGSAEWASRGGPWDALGLGLAVVSATIGLCGISGVADAYGRRAARKARADATSPRPSAPRGADRKEGDVSGAAGLLITLGFTAMLVGVCSLGVGLAWAIGSYGTGLVLLAVSWWMLGSPPVAALSPACDASDRALRRASRLQIAGVVVLLLGGLCGVGTLAFWSSGASGWDRLGHDLMGWLLLLLGSLLVPAGITLLAVAQYVRHRPDPVELPRARARARTRARTR